MFLYQRVILLYPWYSPALLDCTPIVLPNKNHLYCFRCHVYGTIPSISSYHLNPLNLSAVDDIHIMTMTIVIVIVIYILHLSPSISTYLYPYQCISIISGFVFFDMYISQYLSIYHFIHLPSTYLLIYLPTYLLISIHI